MSRGLTLATLMVLALILLTRGVHARPHEEGNERETRALHVLAPRAAGTFLGEMEEFGGNLHNGPHAVYQPSGPNGVYQPSGPNGVYQPSGPNGR